MVTLSIVAFAPSVFALTPSAFELFRSPCSGSVSPAVESFGAEGSGGIGTVSHGRKNLAGIASSVEGENADEAGVLIKSMGITEVVS